MFWAIDGDHVANERLKRWSRQKGSFECKRILKATTRPLRDLQCFAACVFDADLIAFWTLELPSGHDLIGITLRIVPVHVNCLAFAPVIRWSTLRCALSHVWVNLAALVPDLNLVIRASSVKAPSTHRSARFARNVVPIKINRWPILASVVVERRCLIAALAEHITFELAAVVFELDLVIRTTTAQSPPCHSSSCIALHIVAVKVDGHPFLSTTASLVVQVCRILFASRN